MKKMTVRLIGIIILNAYCALAMAQKDIYEVRVYRLKSQEQIDATDNYLKNAYLPALHRLGIKQVGVFKPISNDTAAIKEIFVILPFASLDSWQKANLEIESDPAYTEAARSFEEADTSHLPYVRMESSLLQAFPGQMKLIPTSLKSNPDAIYELRSYESPTEKLHKIKVDMFNRGDEIALFKSLDFQAVFYGDVLSGNHMPNLVYMVVFPDLASRESHWKAFLASEHWKKISADPQYQNNISVSHIDSILMRRTAYSDL